MRKVSVYRHGFTMGTAGTASNHKRAIRGTVSGWSTSATRRNIAFLRSIDETKVSTHNGKSLRALAVTLTLRDCPASSDDWHTIRTNFIKRLRRMGMVRMHWVTEWQRRGVPHLHGAVWVHADDFTIPSKIIESWCDLVADYRASPRAQYILDITDPVGWFQYMAKHAARGVNHYQRSVKNIPESWKQKTGRVWGKVGEWEGVTVPAGDVHLSDDSYYKMRRLARRWRIADARASVSSYGAARISSARRMLKCNDELRSNVRGVSEWLSETVTLAIIYWLLSEEAKREAS